MPEYAYRRLSPDQRASWPWFTVTIVKPGPRGGKRPPLIDVRVQAPSYDDAVEWAKEKLFTRCAITVAY